MEMVPVTSSNLKSVGYDSLTQIMRIKFHSQEMYQYSNIPASVYFGLMQASSKGSYFAQYIKDIYIGHKIFSI